MKIYDVNLRKGINEQDKIVRESLEFTDILKLNEEELDTLKELFDPSAAREKFINFLISKYNIQYIFITMGENGASLYTRDGVSLHADTPRIEVVDTTGCGDAFVASIVRSFLSNLGHREILENAVDISSKIATRKGAIVDSI